MRFDIFTRALQTMGLTNYVFEVVPKVESDLANVTRLVLNEDSSISQVTDPALFEFTWQEIAQVIESLPKFGSIQLREKRDIVNTIVNEWCVKYKRHFSSADKPNTGYTNRNKFVNLLRKSYQDIQILKKNNIKYSLVIVFLKIIRKIPQFFFR